MKSIVGDKSAIGAARGRFIHERVVFSDIRSGAVAGISLMQHTSGY
jgi:hypothetical protein